MANTQTTNVTSRDQISNPYSRENRAEYKMGIIENWLHNMGFKTGYDTYHMEMDNNANAWETQNQSAAYEENYNSAEAEAQRMRNAGLNPDIDPSTVQPGEATEMTEPETTIPTKGQTDIDYFQQVGSFAANLGATLIDMYTGSVSAKAALTGAKVAMGRYESERDIQEDEAIREQALDALYNIGSDEEYENGSYIARLKGLTGKRYEKFARYYDEIYSNLPALITRNKAEADAKNTVFENEITDTMNNIKSIMAEAQTKSAEILLEKQKRETEFLKNHPEYNEAETDALIKQGNKEAIEYRNISLEAQATLDKINSDAIKDYEESIKEHTGGHYEQEGPNRYWVPGSEEEWKGDYWRYRRARKRIGAQGTSFKIAGYGISD